MSNTIVHNGTTFIWKTIEVKPGKFETGYFTESNDQRYIPNFGVFFRDTNALRIPKELCK